MSPSLAEFMSQCQSRLEQLLTVYLKKAPTAAILLQEAMDYAVSNGGKRIRPLLVYATGRALNVEWDALDAPAVAIELIHTYSLIHDDLPAMDNADLRRGKPSCHKAFNEALAILAGDTLQPLAFEIIAAHSCPLSAHQRIAMIKTLTKACGLQGMAAGQVLDLQGLNSLDALTELYQLKTGALFNAAILLGMHAATDIPQAIQLALQQMAASLGFAFQIQDDLLDMESHSDLTGKPQGLDVINKKVTYPMLLGKEKTHAQLSDLYASAQRAIALLGTKADILCSLADYLLQRKK